MVKNSSQSKAAKKPAAKKSAAKKSAAKKLAVKKVGEKKTTKKSKIAAPPHLRRDEAWEPILLDLEDDSDGEADCLGEQSYTVTTYAHDSDGEIDLSDGFPSDELQPVFDDDAGSYDVVAALTAKKKTGSSKKPTKKAKGGKKAKK